MVVTEALTAEEREAQVFPTVIEHKISNLYGGVRGYLLQLVRQELTGRGGLTESQLDEGGLTIVTTIDRAWQRAAADAVRRLPKDRPAALHVAAVSIDPIDGAIRALYGGEDYIERQQNAVTQDIAQAGSTFKPITLAAALATGEHSLGDQYSGRSPIKIADWEVENIGGTSYGWMSLLRATQDSVNTVYAQVNEEIGGATTRRTAIDLGIPEDTVGLDGDLTNVLGTASPHPLDVANVYATLAAQGVRHEAHIVASVTDPEGSEVYTGPTRGTRVLNADAAAEVTYALTEVVKAGTGTAARALERPAAAKTGTSEEHRSAWFCGYTPQMATVVAFYQEGPSGQVVELTPFGGLEEINGGGLPAQVWVEMMAAEHECAPVVEFPARPENLTGRRTGRARSPEVASPSASGSTADAGPSKSADPDPSPVDPVPVPADPVPPPIEPPVPADPVAPATDPAITPVVPPVDPAPPATDPAAPIPIATPSATEEPTAPHPTQTPSTEGSPQTAGPTNSPAPG
jgi:membrane peptidoglycan carboxypeptidase